MSDRKQQRKLELDDFRTAASPAENLAHGEHSIRTKTPWPFLRGPVPIPWLSAAAQLPGRSLAIGVALWFKAGLTSTNRVKPTSTLWRQFGLSRQTVYRGLRQLESAGLVEVQRAQGKNPIVLLKDKIGTGGCHEG